MTRQTLVQPYQTLPSTTASSSSSSPSSAISSSLSSTSEVQSINNSTRLHCNSTSTNIASLCIAHADSALSTSVPDTPNTSTANNITHRKPGSARGEHTSDLDPNTSKSIETTSNSKSDSGIGPGAGADESAHDSSHEQQNPSFTAHLQDHLKLFFSMHHKLFDLVAFYVVMFAINGQMTSLPTRLEWIGFCVQSIVALRRAFQTSIKHGLGLTSFLGMLDLLVGQLFLHQDRLGLLPTVANILVYFYVINLTRGLVFGDSVSCLLWFLFGLVDIYRKDPSSASILDLTPYKMIPVHTVGFGLYILMSELVDVMLHSAEPDPIQGRYLNYVGAQKEGPVSIRSSRRSSSRSSDPSGLRFELCITEITPFTVSFCLNAVSDAPLEAGQDSSPKSSGNSSTPDDGSRNTSDIVDVSSIKIGSISSSVTRSQQAAKATPGSPRIISTSDIVIHVNYIPWREVQYHFPDDQSFTVYGLTPSTDYEIEMKVHQFSSFVTRIGTRAAPPGTTVPPVMFEALKPVEQPAPKNKNRRSKKNQKNQKDSSEKEAKSKSFLTDATTHTNSSLTSLSKPDIAPSAVEESITTTPAKPVKEEKTPNQLLLEELQASIQSTVEATAAAKTALKKLKRDQGKAEALLRQELEGIGRGQAKALLQDQKRRQKVSFLQESIKQTDAQSFTLEGELSELKASTESSKPDLAKADAAVAEMEDKIKAYQASFATELFPLQNECQRLQAEAKRRESERQDWLSKVAQLQESEIAPLQLRLQRLEQQQVVWHVAAEANKDKDRQTNLKITTLEEEIQKKVQKSLELEESIQELKDSNVALKSLVEKEIEVWENLEREYDQDHQQEYRSHLDLPDPTDSSFWFADQTGTATGISGTRGWLNPGSALDGAGSLRRQANNSGLNDLSLPNSGLMWDLSLPSTSGTPASLEDLSGPSRLLADRSATGATE
ncbi:hypothetical protein BG006_005444 [Podila minutissima]|uniref:Uncharacterized protein n=1 Tax=Podila minutissima TaxID=64525 RepID=A0A9P5SN14_9FUNG|nr:hypothetical protein BG006_005444 [Podila minutissima]